MAATVSLDDARFHDTADFRKLLNKSLVAMRRIPGVEAAAVGLSLPYERSLIMGALRIREGKEAGQAVTADETYVTPGYFETLQIPILAGRSFTEAEGAGSQPVAIANRTFARRFFRGANPVGRHLEWIRSHDRILITGKPLKEGFCHIATYRRQCEPRLPIAALCFRTLKACLSALAS